MTIVLNEDGTQTSTSRLEVIDSPISQPGKCVLCGVYKSDGGFLNFTGPPLDFDFYGVVIFCRECVASMANLFKFLSPEERDRLETRLEAAEQELTTQRKALVGLENAVDSLMALRDVPSRSNVVSGTVVSEPTETDNVSAVVNLDEGFGIRQVNESSSKQGSDGISESRTAINEILGL